MERPEVESLIESKVLRYHSENVARMARIEERIIGIDGNGTGRIGAVQRLEMSLANVLTVVEYLKESMSNVKIDVGGSLKTKTLWAALGSIGVVILGAAGTIFAEWIKKKIGLK